MPLKFEPNYLYSYMVKIFAKNRHRLDKASANEQYPEGQKKTIKFYNLGGTRCFDKNQKVVTKEGSKLISELSTSDYVKSYNHETDEYEYKQVQAVIVNEKNKKPCYRITLDTGEQINCTFDHHIFYQGRYITAKELVSLCKPNK